MRFNFEHSFNLEKILLNHSLWHSFFMQIPPTEIKITFCDLLLWTRINFFSTNARQQTKPHSMFPEQKFNREICEWKLFSDCFQRKIMKKNIFSCSKLYLCHFVSERFYDRNIFFKHFRHKNMSRTCEMLKVSSLLSVATIFPTRFYKFSLEELGDVSVEWVAVQQISINSRQIMLRKVPILPFGKKQHAKGCK